MAPFCYWQVYKDADFYILLAICCISFLIFLYILRVCISIIKVYKQLDRKIILIYLFSFLWAIFYITRIIFSLIEYALVLRNSTQQQDIFNASRYFCVFDTLPTFFLMYLLILIPYYWLKNITLFLQKMKRNQSKDKIILKFFQIYIYLRALIYFSLFFTQIFVQTEHTVQIICDIMIQLLLCEVFFSLCLLCYGLVKLFRNFRALNLNDQRDKKKFRNQYFIMIGCSFIRFAMDFYFIIFQKSFIVQKSCFQNRKTDYTFTALYILFGEAVMHLAPIITILTIYRINFRALAKQSLRSEQEE